MLALVKLEQWAHSKVKTYSSECDSGWRLACALLGDPDVLVLDEPANGLDPEGIRWLRDLLQSLSAQGRTILISSHVLAEIAQTVDDVAIIQKGVSSRTRHSRSSPRAAPKPSACGRRLSNACVTCSRRPASGRASPEPDRLAVEGTPERVGEIAAENGVVLHELRTDASLEQIFLELTGGEEASS